MPKLKRIAGLAFGVALLAAHHKIIPDFCHESTDQEATISEALSHVAGRTIVVRCLTQGEINARVWPFGSQVPGKEKKEATPPLYPLTWLSHTTCSQLISFASLETKELANTNHVKALRVAAHELRHTAGTINEARAECEALQTVGEVARQFGASDKVSLDVSTRVAELMTKNAQLLSPDYALTDACQENGAYDLYPSQPGFFPNVTGNK